jgi:hypothetical protein
VQQSTSLPNIERKLTRIVLRCAACDYRFVLTVEKNPDPLSDGPSL